jgi:hypothetical protein
MILRGMRQSPPKPLGTRVKAAAVVLLIEGVFLAIVGAFVVLIPLPDRRSWDAQEGERLPPRASLARAEGRVVAVEYHSTRRSRFERPKVEFSVEGQPHYVRTLWSYSPGLQPFVAQQQAAWVLYTPARPQEAWLEWEYDRFIAAASVPPPLLDALAERFKAHYWSLAMWIVGLSTLGFVVILFVPSFRPSPQAPL